MKHLIFKMLQAVSGFQVSHIEFDVQMLLPSQIQESDGRMTSFAPNCVAHIQRRSAPFRSHHLLDKDTFPLFLKRLVNFLHCQSNS